MPSSLVFALFVEVLLIGLAGLLLAQPEFVFRTIGRQFRTWAFGSGWFILAILFGWSVVLGRILVDYEIFIRI
jgi:hypothetical protein